MKTIPLINLKHKKGPWQFLFFCWEIGAQKPIDQANRAKRNLKNRRRKARQIATLKDLKGKI